MIKLPKKYFYLKKLNILSVLQTLLTDIKSLLAQNKEFSVNKLLHSHFTQFHLLHTI